MAPMLTCPASSQSKPIIRLHDASKKVIQGVNEVYNAFEGLTFDVYSGERLGIFAVNALEGKTLLHCLSGVEPLDSGALEHQGSVSWPLGSNDAFHGKLSGYMNARFAAEIYSRPGQIDEDLVLIQELSGANDYLYHKPLGDWPNEKKDALRLAVSLAFKFDVITVGRITCWDHQAIHPLSVRIRNCFEQLIEKRTLILCANGQHKLAMDYCEEGFVLLNSEIVYRGDPEVCMEMVKEESKRQRQERRERVGKRIAKLLSSEEENEFDIDDPIDPAQDNEKTIKKI